MRQKSYKKMNKSKDKVKLLLSHLIITIVKMSLKCKETMHRKEEVPPRTSKDYESKSFLSLNKKEYPNDSYKYMDYNSRNMTSGDIQTVQSIDSHLNEAISDHEYIQGELKDEVLKETVQSTGSYLNEAISDHENIQDEVCKGTVQSNGSHLKEGISDLENIRSEIPLLIKKIHIFIKDIDSRTGIDKISEEIFVTKYNEILNSTINIPSFFVINNICIVPNISSQKIEGKSIGNSYISSFENCGGCECIGSCAFKLTINIKRVEIFNFFRNPNMEELMSILCDFNKYMTRNLKNFQAIMGCNERCNNSINAYIFLNKLISEANPNKRQSALNLITAFFNIWLNGLNKKEISFESIGFSFCFLPDVTDVCIPKIFGMFFTVDELIEYTNLKEDEKVALSIFNKKMNKEAIYKTFSSFVKNSDLIEEIQLQAYNESSSETEVEAHVVYQEGVIDDGSVPWDQSDSEDEGYLSVT